MTDILVTPIDVPVVRRSIRLDYGDELEVTQRATGNAPTMLVLQSDGRYHEVELPEGAKATMTVEPR